MTKRTRSVLIAVGFFALAALVGVILGSVWLGLVIGLAIGVGALIAGESKRGGHQGYYDDHDDGAEL
ncbi:hypothetical protein [Microbacterium indicum]|uniref:hypothetical protein n=1 Tax=Microbacterium indicum TaxID=358100 RepID=UPI00041EED68|nr:hypothetical protein [Microbacterium indicum]